MAAGAGEKWMLDYARRLSAQEPIWIRGNSRAVASVAAGEHALSHGVNYGPAITAAAQDRNGCLQVKILEPILARINKPYFVLNSATNAYSGLLWLEFLGSPPAQAILDRFGESSGSILAPDSESARIVRGKKVWLRDWITIHEAEKWIKMSLEAFGVPKAEPQR
jgi:hypothetical protein